MPFAIGIRRLSQMVIDSIKNWGGQRIDNVGAPNTDDDVPRARAGDILSGRFGMVRMPDGTSGQVLTAQGVGVDPAYAVGAKLASGSYVGDTVNGRVITVGFTPTLVYIRNRNPGWNYAYILHSTVTADNERIGDAGSGRCDSIISTNGFTLQWGTAETTSNWANRSPQNYDWVAIG